MTSPPNRTVITSESSITPNHPPRSSLETDSHSTQAIQGSARRLNPRLKTVGQPGSSNLANHSSTSDRSPVSRHHQPSRQPGSGDGAKRPVSAAESHNQPTTRCIRHRPHRRQLGEMIGTNPLAEEDHRE